MGAVKVIFPRTIDVGIGILKGVLKGFLFCSSWLMVLIFHCTVVYAQVPEIVFTPVAPEVFSNSFVRCFYKDSNGFMWLGTADGLVRYDGTNAFHYNHNPDQRYSLCHNNINAIVEDSQQRLWIGTAQGLCVYSRETDRFITVDSIPGIKNHLNNRYITALSFDQQGALWIGTHGNGINLFDPKEQKFSYLVADANTAKATDYVSTLLYVDGMMWSGTKGGLRLYNTKSRTSSPMTFVGEQLPVRQVSQLLVDNAGNIWFTTVNGELIKIIPKNGYYTFQNVISGASMYGASWNNILTLCRDVKGNMWIAGENSGLNYLDTKSGKVTRYLADEGDSKKLATNSIRTVYIDDEGLTWIGTFNKGAYLIDNDTRKFLRHKPYQGKENNFLGKDVKSFAEDRSGNIWMAVDEIGLAKVDFKSNTLQRLDAINTKLTNKYYTSILFDRYGFLWVGSVGSGVYKIDPRSNEVKTYSLASGGFGEDKVFCLYEDKMGTIWAGTSGSGLFYFDPESNGFKVLFEEGKPNHITKTAYVSSVVEDAEGILWVGTMYGLHALRKHDEQAYDYKLYLPNERPGSLSSSGVQLLYEDKQKNLWIGTTDNGLNVKIASDSLFQAFQKKDGLPGNTIRGVVADAKGNLWISGNMGLSKLDPATHAIATYTREDGLPSNNFYSNACLWTSAGEIFLGTNNGFTVFYPDSIRTRLRNPVVYFTDLKINNQSVSIGTPDSPLNKHISLTSGISLSYEQRSFAIDFVALNLAHSTKLNYCYKLEGFDKAWNYTGSNHSAPYTNMDPGDYTLLVKASTSEGRWSDTPARLEITIHPLIWRTWWAMSLYIIVLSGLVLLLIWIRMERLRMKNQLKVERLARVREHELSESKTQFFTNISHEFRTPLSLILLPLESLITGDDVSPLVKERIASAYRSADKMMRLVNELMDFNKLEGGHLKLDLQYGELVSRITEIASAFEDVALKRNILFVQTAQVTALQGWFDLDKLEKILVNVLSNAFKFTCDQGTIQLLINSKTQPVGPRNVMARCLELVVVDNGIGISTEEIPFIFDKFYQAKSASKIPNPGTGIGLSLTKALVELHHGYIKAESVPGRETRFVMVVPIDAEVFQVETQADPPAKVFASTEQSFSAESVAVRDDNREKSDILIIEDNDELRTYLALELVRQFNVLQAKDGQQGLDMALEKIPDLIISDVLMPHKSGIELCQFLKSDLKTSHIPIILLTARASLEDKISGIETGADIYLTKPFSIRLLMSHVRNLIESRQKLYAHFSQDVYLLPAKNAASEMDQVFLQRIVDHIVDHLQDTQLGVDSLAEIFNLSRVQVYRKIKALTGKTAVEFIRTVRLKQALKLMETKKYTLSEIAYKTGFNSASYFTRSFKEEYGKAPSEFLAVTG